MSPDTSSPSDSTDTEDTDADDTTDADDGMSDIREAVAKRADKRSELSFKIRDIAERNSDLPDH